MSENLLEAQSPDHDSAKALRRKLDDKNMKILELEKNLEGFGKLAVERDRLLFELEAYQKAELTRQESDSPQVERMSEHLLEAQSPDRDSVKALERKLEERNLKIFELETNLKGFGKLAVERDRLLFELEAYQKAELTRQNSESPKIERMSERPIEATPDRDNDNAIESELDEKNRKIIEPEKSLEGFGKLAVERDQLLFELEAYQKAELPRQKRDSPQVERMSEHLLEAQSPDNDSVKALERKLEQRNIKILELEKNLEGFGKLAVERDRLLFELEAYQKAELTRPKSDSPQVERMSEHLLEAQSPDRDSVKALERKLEERNLKILELET